MYTADFREGQRVELHPASDYWMMGDRMGTIVKVGRSLLKVKMDHSGRTRRLTPEHIGRVFV